MFHMLRNGNAHISFASSFFSFYMYKSAVYIFFYFSIIIKKVQSNLAFSENLSTLPAPVSSSDIFVSSMRFL